MRSNLVAFFKSIFNAESDRNDFHPIFAIIKLVNSKHTLVVALTITRYIYTHTHSHTIQHYTYALSYFFFSSSLVFICWQLKYSQQREKKKKEMKRTEKKIEKRKMRGRKISKEVKQRMKKWSYFNLWEEKTFLNIKYDSVFFFRFHFSSFLSVCLSFSFSFSFNIFFCTPFAVYWLDVCVFCTLKCEKIKVAVFGCYICELFFMTHSSTHSNAS